MLLCLIAALSLAATAQTPSVSARSPAGDFAEIRTLLEQPATPERLARIEVLLLPHDSVAETRHRDDLIGAHAAMRRSH